MFHTKEDYKLLKTLYKELKQIGGQVTPIPPSLNWSRDRSTGQYVLIIPNATPLLQYIMMSFFHTQKIKQNDQEILYRNIQHPNVKVNAQGTPQNLVVRIKMLLNINNQTMKKIEQMMNFTKGSSSSSGIGSSVASLGSLLSKGMQMKIKRGSEKVPLEGGDITAISFKCTIINGVIQCPKAKVSYGYMKAMYRKVLHLPMFRFTGMNTTQNQEAVLTFLTMKYKMAHYITQYVYSSLVNFTKMKSF